VHDSARTPAYVAWPEKLITQAEAFVLAAAWPVRVVVRGDSGNLADLDIDLWCGKCGRSCGQLRRGRTTYNGTLDEMLSMVLRHMVMAHDVPLAGLRKDTG
jgi:hypothetical protein